MLSTSSPSSIPTYQASTKFLRLSHLRKLRRCEQVAAICYRLGTAGIEFLLVQTRGARWTFPKGSAEPGLTHAQAAALEAFEEAGVHGRMEEASFTRYIRRKGTENSAARSNEKEIAVSAHLCEVRRLGPPQELDRCPTWFSAPKAKRRLRERRTPDYGAELTRVIDRAVVRIRRLQERIGSPIYGAQEDISQKAGWQKERALRNSRGKDALQAVQFTIIDSRSVANRPSREIAGNRRNVSQIDHWNPH